MELSSDDFFRLRRFYNRSLNLYGPDSPRALHWPTPQDQEARFGALTRVGNLSDASVLDVGCGLGDLYYFLLKKFSRVAYTGIDLVPEMVSQAREKYPDVAFSVRSIFELDKPFDYVLASGALTFNVSGGKKFYYSLIAHMYYLCNTAVAFNMLDDIKHTTDEDYLAYNWHEVITFCKTLTENYKVITGYEPGDFTIYLYKGARGVPSL